MSVRDTLRYVANRHVPRWFRNRVGKSVAYRIIAALAAVFDALLWWARQGAKARMPGLGTPTALGRIARDRGYIRGFAQSDAVLAGRVQGWKEAHRRKGHPFEVLRQLRGYLAPYAVKVRHVDASGNWHTIEADGTEVRQNLPGSWDWGPAARWWWFWIIVYLPAELWPVWEAMDGEQWSGNMADDGDTLGQQAPFAACEDVRAVVGQWKAENVYCRYIIIAYDEADFVPTDPASLPDGTWESPIDNSDPPNETRNPNARFWEGVV